jgi:hypothetical protein
MSSALPDLIDKLDKNKKYTMTDKEKISIEAVSQKNDMKPKGLWYSCGPDWVEWVVSNMPHWAKKNIYEIGIGGNVLRISNSRELREFSNKYKTGIPGGLSTLHDLYDNLYIDWPKVAKEYDGIEICPYIGACRMEMNWYYPWDVASGCLWNQAGLSNTKLIAQYDENQDKYVFV